MKKIAMLSAAAIIGIAGISISQADDDVIETPVETSIADAADAQDVEMEELIGESAASVDSTTPRASDGEAQPVSESEVLEKGEADEVIEEELEPAEPIPQDPPQVQELIKNYPQLVQRIQPYGTVCFEGEDCDITLTASGGSADGEPRDGDAVYNAICQTCHASGLLGSPVLGDAGAWGPRISQGVETLYDHAINGYNSMPAKGGADIPDEEVQNAVDYMIEQSQ